MTFSRENILPLIDLTSLNETDDATRIGILCEKAISPQAHVAAVCVYPAFVQQAARFFLGKPVKVATVANFPTGEDPLDEVLLSIRNSISLGASEIDVVFPYKQYLAGDKMGAYQFIVACKEVCGSHILLKVILETGALQDPVIITEASRNALLAGADFLKTSTGKISVGATLPAARAMLMVIKEFSVMQDRAIGLKVSGGIRTVEDALTYIELAAEIMGPEWVQPEHFRIGASALVDCLVVH